jgi:transcriptional regulator with XRE-family HTH domain
MPENLAGCKRLPARTSWTPEKMAERMPAAMTKKPITPFQAALIARLRAVQKEMGKSDSQMAQIVGDVGRTVWGQWVTGGNMPSEEAMVRLCDEAKITLDWLYRGKLRNIDPGLSIRLEMRVAGLDPDDATDAERSRVMERVLASMT